MKDPTESGEVIFRTRSMFRKRSGRPRSWTRNAVLRVTAVEPGHVDALLVELGQPGVRPLAQLVELAELDRLGGTGLGAGRGLPFLEAVVAQGALERPTVVLAQVDDAVGAGRHAVAAAVADVGLHHHRAVLRAE